LSGVALLLAGAVCVWGGCVAESRTESDEEPSNRASIALTPGLVDRVDAPVADPETPLLVSDPTVEGGIKESLADPVAIEITDDDLADAYAKGGPPFCFSLVGKTCPNNPVGTDCRSNGHTEQK